MVTSNGPTGTGRKVPVSMSWPGIARSSLVPRIASGPGNQPKLSNTSGPTTGAGNRAALAPGPKICPALTFRATTNHEYRRSRNIEAGLNGTPFGAVRYGGGGG